MELTLGILQFLICIFIILYEYNKKSISIFFWAVTAIMFSIPHLLGILVSNTSEYSTEVINKASLFVLMFELLYILTRFFILRNKIYNSIPNEKEIKLEITKGDEKDNLEFKRIFKICIIVFFVFVMYFIFMFGRITNITWGDVYQASINANSLLDKILEFLKSIAHILFFGVSGLFVVSIYKKNKIVTCFVIFLILYYSLITKNRMTLLPLLVGIIFIFIMKNKKLKIKQILLFTIIGALSIYIVYAIWIFRHAGTVENFMSKYTFSSFNEEVFNSILNGDGELALKNIFYYFIKIDNNFPGLGQGATYMRLLFIFIPTKLCFGLKPDDFAITMSSAYTGDLYNTNYSVHPTFFGDLFANFNFYGFVFGIVWAIIFFILDKYISKKDYIMKFCLCVSWGSCFIIMARGSVYNSMYIAIISTIFLKLIEIFKNKKIVFK